MDFFEPKFKEHLSTKCISILIKPKLINLWNAELFLAKTRVCSKLPDNVLYTIVDDTIDNVLCTIKTRSVKTHFKVLKVTVILSN